MKVLVTGGSGFLGSALCTALAARGDSVLALDLRASPAMDELASLNPGRFAFDICEVVDRTRLRDCMERYSPDAIVHCAAIVGVSNSVSGPADTLRTNIEGSLNVFALARENRIGRVVNISSEEVYGDFVSDPITEDAACLPLKPYGISKFAVERLACEYDADDDPDIIHVRLSWAYGAGLPRPRIPKIIVDAALTGTPLHMPSGADFRVDHTYIDDAVAGLMAALDVGRHDHAAYNIGSGTAPSLGEIVDIVKNLVPGADMEVGPGDYEFQPGLKAVRKGAMDISRARRELGYEPAFDIARGLEDCIRIQRNMMGKG